MVTLKSLVVWGTTGNAPPENNPDSATKSQTGEDSRTEAMTPDPSSDRLSGLPESFRQPTPELSDDPNKFESARQKKTTLLEGIKKFNFKPKRVSALSSWSANEY